MDASLGSIQLIGYTSGSLASKELSDCAGDTAEAIAAVRRELEFARSELRLDPDAHVPLVVCGQRERLASEAAAELGFEISSIESLFPFVEAGTKNFGAQAGAVAFAAALTAVDRSLPFSLNLLPPEKRSYQSPMVYLPAYALAGVILLLTLALGLRSSYQDWRYQQYIQQQIQSLQPQLSAVQTAEQQSKRAHERLALLESMRNTATLPLEVLSELTRLLPEDTSLQMMQYDANVVSLTGYAKSASSLLEILAGSSYFESSQFLSSIGKLPDGKEAFRIGIRLRNNK
jgi:Tfp pilus assembly protein PilN